MLTLILVLIMLGVAVYFDVRYRGMPKYLPILFCGIGVGVNLLMGSNLDETFAMLLLVCGLLCLVSFTRIYAWHDAMMLCAITLTTPFIGWMIPSVVCGALGILCGLATLLILCRIRNAEQPYIEIKNISKEKIKFARVISHVNGGQKFVVPAIKTDKDEEESHLHQNMMQKILINWRQKIGTWNESQTKPDNDEERFNFNASRSRMGKTDAKYVIPIIPPMPFFAGWYVFFVVVMLFF